MSIEIIVAKKQGDKTGTQAFAFPDKDAAAGFIADVFARYGNSVAVAVAVDGVPVKWSYNDAILTIGEPLANPTIH